MKQEIGGMRLGSGSKLSVEMKNYQRSTHDLGYIWRSSMAPGTLVPFMVEIGLPGDTFDIDLNAAVLTHPTLGPLFGSFKVQLDVFEAPVRLYQPALMQNLTQIGNNMASIPLPAMQCSTIPATTITAQNSQTPDNLQINGSALMSYLGIRGWGNNTLETTNTRQFHAVPMLMYWEIYKNYYANKQEVQGAFIVPPGEGYQNVTGVTVNLITINQNQQTAPGVTIIGGNNIVVTYGAGLPPDFNQFLFYTNIGTITGTTLGLWVTTSSTTSLWVATNQWQGVTFYGWGYAPIGAVPVVEMFDLSNIDSMKTLIMQTSPTTQFLFDETAQDPYGKSINITITPASQCGLGLKTYQSDIFNNWMNQDWWNTITSNTEVSTAGNVFTIDSLILARKVYDLLNRIAISGGSYNDWINAAYAHEPMSICTSPIYHGGLSKELVFQEVVSLTQNAAGNQPLGTLAGRGTMAKKHKGGKIVIKCSEITYIMGIVSLTPRLDYSQGNRWYTGLNTMNDYHKPALDQIGFQDLITEYMAWWSTYSVAASAWTQESAGVQPAWINYMTNYNRCYGNFADPSNEMFMTLNRRYQCDPSTGVIDDLTTYINPSHYNYIFAQTNLDAQNFWTQIAVDITARRKMSAKIMPNL